jgi:ornithine lipid hydroxylase
MKNFISKWLLLSTVLSSMVVFWATFKAGGNIELAVTASTVVVLALSLIIERVMPFNRDRNQTKLDTAIDLPSAGVLLGITDPLIKYLAPIGILHLYTAIDLPVGFNFFPTTTPFLAQLLLATLTIELLKYGAHRWHHENRYLWWLHAMHHSSERLYAVNNFRFHPLNYLINFTLSVLPLMLISVPSEVLFGYMALTQPVLMLQHSNIDLRSGWLNYIFSTNELHRWHHSTNPTEANTNYGNALSVWDIVFSTFKYERHSNAPLQIGLFSTSKHYPARSSYLQQLLSVFSPQCCKA